MRSTVTPPEHPSATERRTGSSFTRNRAKLYIAVVLSLPVSALAAFSLQHRDDIKNIFAPVDESGRDSVCIYDRYDRIVCTLTGKETRIPVRLSAISAAMQEAAVAAEDHAFYSHHGINPEAIIRAALVDLRSGKELQGGSTITQQLAKNLCASGGKRTIWQKLKESVIAWELENRYSKSELLEAYLNEVYFGRGAYGVERAAHVFFGKTAAQLNLPESAFLAGLISSPSRLSSSINRPEALHRQSAILDDMVECNFIRSPAASRAKLAPLRVRGYSTGDASNMYYIDAVLAQIQNLRNSTGDRHGLNVYTNLDQAAQRQAVAALNRGVQQAPRGVSQAALVSISVKDGSVLALVGGTGDYWKHQYNRATSPHTVGSAFKPFVYLSAILAAVITPHTVLNDEPISIARGAAPPYSPRNYDSRFLGPITVREALAKSRNVCAVQVAADTGIDKVIRTARLAGINAPLSPEPSLALGACAVSPLEMASAYSTLARGGVMVQPSLIRKVKDFNGNVLLDEHPASVQVFDRESVAQLVDLLQDVVRIGTGTGAQIPGRAVAGKTGTADQAKDLWFVGFTPDLVTATWGGNDQNRPIPGTRVTGGSVMARIWRNYMMSYYRSHRTLIANFTPPSTPMDRGVVTQTATTDDANKNATPEDTAAKTDEARSADSSHPADSSKPEGSKQIADVRPSTDDRQGANTQQPLDAHQSTDNHQPPDNDQMTGAHPDDQAPSNQTAAARHGRSSAGKIAAKHTDGTQKSSDAPQQNAEHKKEHPVERSNAIRIKDNKQESSDGSEEDSRDEDDIPQNSNEQH